MTTRENCYEENPTTIDVDECEESALNRTHATTMPQQQQAANRNNETILGANVRLDVTRNQHHDPPPAPCACDVLVGDPEQGLSTAQAPDTYYASLSSSQDPHLAQTTLPTATPLSLPTNNANNSTLDTSISNPDIMEAAVARVPDATLPMDQSNTTSNQHTSDGTTAATKVVGQAQPAHFADFLENRSLQWALGAVLCTAISLAALVLGLVVWSQQQQSTGNPKETPQQRPVVDPLALPTLIPTPVPARLPTASATPDPTTAPIVQPITSAPTAAPLLLELSSETIQRLMNPFSPQAQAYEWLRNHTHLDTMLPFQRAQAMGVLTIYYALNGEESFWSSEFSSPRGNWLSYEVPFCEWTPFQNALDGAGSGVQNENSHLGGCNAAGQLTHLNLHNIDGTVITSHLHGRLPIEIDLLTHLERLEIHNCRFINSELEFFLPPALGGLTNLQKIQYVGNNLEGTIPVLPLVNLTQLTHLSFDSNRLSGAIPSGFGSMRQLEFLSLSWNRLQDAIPSQIGLLNGLETLRLYKNRLVGPVPSEIAQMSALKTLQLQRNNIEGMLPFGLCDGLFNLTLLQLDCHQLSCVAGCDCNCRG